MATELNYSDETIDKIDFELLKLYNASQNKTEYQFFDFYDELIKFNKYVLKDGSRKEYFDLQASQYKSVFRDLMFTVSMWLGTKYISYDPINRILKTEETTSLSKVVSIKVELIERKINKESEHNFFKENIDEFILNPSSMHGVVKYNYLLIGCKSINKELRYMNLSKIEFDLLFKDYSIDPNERITFEKYIKRLPAIKKHLSDKSETTDCLAGSNESNTDKECIVDDILKKMFGVIKPNDLTNLKRHLRGYKGFIENLSLDYIGTRTGLEAHSKELKDAGIDRTELLNVLVKHVRYKKNTWSPSVKYTLEQLKHKI